MRVWGKMFVGFILILSLMVAVSASTSNNWSFNSGSQVGNVFTKVTEPVSTKIVEIKNEISPPHGAIMWTSDPVAAVSNESVGSDPWSTSGPVSSPSTQGLANTDGWG